MKPQLRNVKAFEDALQNYQMSDRMKHLLAQLRLVILVAPTAAGRNTVIKKLCEDEAYEFIISDTTRPIRRKDGALIERDGENYHFRSEEEVLQDLREGKYLEADIIHNQQVSGINIRALERLAQSNKIAVGEINYIGADKVIAAKPDTTMIFLLPPNFDEWMHRLQSRSDISTEEIQNRLESAEKELQAGLEKPYYTFVINDDYQRAAKAIDSLILGGTYTQKMHESAKELAWSLLGSVKHHLNS